MTISDILQSVNILILPLLIYVVRIEHRITKIEAGLGKA